MDPELSGKLRNFKNEVSRYEYHTLCCGYSLEWSCQDNSNEYQQHMV